MTALPVTQHPASVDAYIRHGWSLVPVPPGTKGPSTSGWNLRENALTSQHQLPAGWGIGLAHAYSGTMAVDVDVWDRAAFELMMHGIDLRALYDAPDAVIVDSGRQGHGKLLYAMPMGMALPSKKFLDTDAEGKRFNYLDFRCGTANGRTVQDILPPSIHPDTNQPYQWAGRGHWTRLPLIPHDLLRFWNDSLVVPERVESITPGSVEWGDIRDALGHISPDCSRDEWVVVGMALHHAGHQTGENDYAMQLWDEWSSTSGKYKGIREIATQWRSFRSDKTTAVKLGSLFHLAAKHGWTRPLPDVAAMFACGAAVDPVSVALDIKPTPPALDFSLMPPVLADAARHVGESVGCDPLVPLWAGIAAISAAMDARTRLEVRPGFQVPPVLWVMTIGDPADKKTPGSTPMMSTLTDIEAEDRPRFQQAMQVFEVLEAQHEMARKAFLDAAKDPHAILAGEMPPGYGEAPKMPTPLRVVVQDITSQKLVRVAADNPRGVLCYLDEMNSWVRKLMDPRGTDSISTWTTAYESRYYKMDRVGTSAGTLELEATNYAVSIYGNIQPRVFAASVSKLSEDGLLQRFIPIVLREKFTRLGHPTAGRKAALEAFDLIVRQVYGLPALTYKLNPEAENAYVEFQKWYHQRLKDEKLLRVGDIYLQSFGKLEGLTGRLILLMHAILDPFSITVKPETVERVVQLMKSYVIPSMRYTYNGELANVNSFDRWVMEYVIQHANEQYISTADIRRNATRQFGENKTRQSQVDLIVSAMYPLEKALWVARIDDATRDIEGKVVWAVNPALVEQFKDHRLSIIEAKQRMMDHVYRDAAEGNRPRVHGADELENRG